MEWKDARGRKPGKETPIMTDGPLDSERTSMARRGNHLQLHGYVAQDRPDLAETARKVSQRIEYLTERNEQRLTRAIRCLASNPRGGVDVSRGLGR